MTENAVDYEPKVPEVSGLHPSVAHVLQYFAYSHLPLSLQNVSYRFCELAQEMAYSMPPSAEVTIGLRKLLEAKDCFVRAAVFTQTPEEHKPHA